jgi:hypothetical protein
MRFAAGAVVIGTVLLAGDNTEITLETLEVVGHRQSLLGESLSASEGIVGAEEIEQRPLLRTGELLEFVPGMVVTQHSGTGKANQYFLRGFNLDHGTDFATYFDGMPLNMRTHGHGQGYTDLNFIIPETIAYIDYAKGSYSADSGDFSAAGSAHFSLKDKPRSELLFTYGEYNYLRGVGIVSTEAGEGRLYAAAERNEYDGPWSDIKEDIGKTSAVARYSAPLGDYTATVTLMAYDNSWNAADQIPDRAVREGLIDLYGSIDTDAGGSSERYSLSGSLRGNDFEVSAYVVRYAMDLYSNFTYFLEDPLNGDEFEQVDKRNMYGGEGYYRFEGTLGGVHWYQRVGTQLRYDDIDEVGLYNTKSRARLHTVRRDAVKEGSAGFYYQAQGMLGDALTLTLGLRYDQYYVDVDALRDENSGTAEAGIASPKLSLTYAMGDAWEAYLSAGEGFHSNDARGATISVDPSSGEAVESVDLLVKTRGGEIGARYYAADAMHLSLSLWMLDIDSELLYVGDAGTTEPNRASRRYGVEFSGYYWIGDALSADLELAWSHARFKEHDDEEGDYIEGSLPFVAAAGITYAPTQGLFGTLRMRHFGARTLDSYDDHRSDTSTLFNASLGYKRGGWKVWLELLNLFDSEDHDIDYYYASRLQGEPAEGVEDIHFHPLEPRMVRGGVSYRF